MTRKFQMMLSAATLALALSGPVAQSWAQGAGEPYGQPSTAKGDWPLNFADTFGSRYSPQDQINATNFNKLEVAWRLKTDMFGARPEYKLEGTPLEVNGTVYTTAGSRRDVVALDARTGELKWTFSLNEGARANASPRQLSGRGVSYWTDGKGDERILYVTTGYRLVELNAKDGHLIDSFGDHGMIDMKVGVVTGVMGHPGEYKQIDLTTGEIGLHSTPTVADGVVIVGSSMKEGYQPVTQNNTKGLVRGWDVKTGQLLWTFHDVPMKGEFGYDSWKNNSADFNGNTGVWTGITVDPELGSVYLPIEDPTLDTYGGARPGNDLFGDSLVCVDLHTGKMKWYYQVVHHPLWDFDLSSAPMLVDAVVGGKPVKQVAVPSKQGFLYVFDRVTGKPVWPMPEKPVPQSDVPGEQTSKTQPFPSKPPAYSRQQLNMADLVDFTPELHAKAAELIKQYKVGPMFTPPVLSSLTGPLSTLGYDSSAGTNWTGGAFDPETHTVFVPAAPSLVSLHGLVVPPPGYSDEKYLGGTAGQPFVVLGGAGAGAGADAPKQSAEDIRLAAILAKSGAAKATGPAPSKTVDGLPIVKPPYGTITAINMDTGDFRWQIAHGDTPDEIRNNPALKGITLPKTGQAGNVGILATKTLVISGDPLSSTQPGHPKGAYLHAYDKMTGAEVGKIWMPAPQSGNPMTYSYQGKQYIVVAVSGGNYSGEYIAYRLP
ncbi:MAG TPA: PQQ-binding-like beta-propeller repeat protein [Caulobacteraceae bacterium]|nr:PQQ-binding-like beta-propeller repeat protein [Caulobacteraceae bacterium]